MPRTLKAELNDLQRYALSFNEIYRMCNGNIPGLKVKFVENETAKWNKQVWGKANALVVLLETPGGQRHWVSLGGKGKGWYYDSLAMKPSWYKKTFPAFYDFVKDREWNSHKHQPQIQHSATCGDFTLVRLIHHEYSNSSFHKYLSSLRMNLERVVALICYLNTRSLKVPEV